MDSLDFYVNQKRKNEDLLRIAQITQSKYKYIRLVAFVVALVIPFVVSDSVFVSALFFLLGISAFLFVVRRDILLDIRIAKIESLIEAATQEINAIETDQFPGRNGSCFSNRKHAYSSDLNIFGERSLYHFLNRTHTAAAEQLLANWLKAPASKAEIEKRQQAVRELVSKPELLIEIRSLAVLKNRNKEKNDLSGLDLKTDAFWPRLKIAFGYAVAFSLLNLVLIGTYFTGHLNYLFLLAAVGFNYVLFSSLYRKVTKQAEPVLGQSRDLCFFEDFIAVFEREQVQSQLLNDLAREFSAAGESGSVVISRIRKLLHRTDHRYNLALQLVLFSWCYADVAFLFDYWRVQRRYSGFLTRWLHAVAHLEVLSSFAVMQFNQSWLFPSISENPIQFVAEGLGHPLIPSAKRVVNDVRFDDRNRMLIVTGSNMSGKSTFLRSVGVNLVLALAGAPVCAAKFETGPFELMTYMVISDSLNENVSTFQAELLRIKQILDASRTKHNLFVLLDELLRGTNTTDRELGCKAIVRHIAHHQLFAVVATHDLSLANMEQQFPRQIRNAHFDIQIETGKMFFDYKLKSGVCQSFNASMLLKEIGLDLNDASGDASRN
ncbi:hypothetical protein [Mangrovibacterium sp.]|uniref:MutS-related protein n=1 Tax=Mangrovibacterium sp. TaxID=1961364 RepID=UPI00356533EA